MAVFSEERRGVVKGKPGFGILVTEVSWNVKTLMGLETVLFASGMLM